MPVFPSHRSIDEPPRRAGRVDLRSQSGFTLVELGVVMVIVGILMAGGAYMMLSGRKATAARSIATAANAYSDAVNAFRLEHRRVPTLGAVGEWPDAGQGPLDALGKPFIRGGVPSAVADGVATLSDDPSAAAGSRGRITYVRVSDQTYRLVVEIADDSGFTVYCEVGNEVSPGSNTC